MSYLSNQYRELRRKGFQNLSDKQYEEFEYKLGREILKREFRAGIVGLVLGILLTGTFVTVLRILS